MRVDLRLKFNCRFASQIKYLITYRTVTTSSQSIAHLKASKNFIVRRSGIIFGSVKEGDHIDFRVGSNIACGNIDDF